MRKFAIVSFPMVLLASSAAIAQPNGGGQNYRACYEQPYGPSECAQLRQRPDFERYREQNAAVLPGFIIDPATNTPVTFQQYQARYPRSDRNTWQYDKVRNVWVDLTPQQFLQAQNNREGDRDRERERDRDLNFRACYEQPYGPPECAQLRQRPDFERYREQNAAVLPGFIIDQATNTPVTFQQYQARYPRSDRNTWQYDKVRNVWVDLTPKQYLQPENNREEDRDRERERERERDRDRDRDRRDRDQGDRDQGDYR